METISACWKFFFHTFTFKFIYFYLIFNINFQSIVSKLSSKWICSACTFENNEIRKKCECCDMERPVLDEISPAGAAALSFAAPFNDQTAMSGFSSEPTLNRTFSSGALCAGAWKCNTCMSLNGSDETKCFACTSFKQTKASFCINASDISFGGQQQQVITVVLFLCIYEIFLFET